MVYQKDTDQIFVWNGTAWLYSLTPQTSEAGTWTSWTPSFRSTGGTITSLTVNFAKYTQIQKTVFAKFDFLIVTLGTGSGVVRFDLPFTAATGTQGLAAGVFREINVVGFIGVVNADTTTTGTITKYDNSTPLGSNYRYTGTFTYEVA